MTTGIRSIKNLNETLVFLCWLISLTFINEVHAATYYVSPTGSDSSSGTSSAPFKTIQRAADVVAAGDTVIVKNGTYTDTNNDGLIVNNTKAGTSSNWITFKAENKWGAVLDGQNTANYGWVLNRNAQYIRIEEFEIKNARRGGFWVTYRDKAPFQNNIYFYGNKLHDIARRQIPCSERGGHNGFFAGATATNITIDSNLVYNIGRFPGGCPTVNEYGLDHGIYFFAADTTIINNIFYGTAAGWAIQVIGRTNDWSIINNTFYGSNPQKDGQIMLWGTMSNITIENNISYGSRSYFIDGSWQASAKKKVKIKNNLVYKADVINIAGQGYSVSNNITGKDPKFVSLSEKDFQLQSGSPAIDAGAGARQKYRLSQTP